MDALKKIAVIIVLLLWAGGIICSLVLTAKAGALVPVLAVIVLALMGIPGVRKCFDVLKK